MGTFRIRSLNQSSRISEMAEFQHGLCGCFSDCGSCCMATWCPCIAHGNNAEAVGKSCLLNCLSTFVPFLGQFCVASVRRDVREEQGIEGGFGGDLLVACCCPCCTISQTSATIKGQNISRT